MDHKKSGTLFTLLCLLSNQILAAPADSTQSMIVSPTESSFNTELEKEGVSQENAPTIPKIYQMHVHSNISNRYAHTTITSKVKNIANQAQEAIFSVILPETAFISDFIMEVDGKNYTAYVKEKEEAKREYGQAVANGVGAAHVAVSVRDSNRFTVSVNIEPEKKAAFYLSYEQLLKRQDGHYEQVINLHPGQPVKDLSVEVIITESRKVTDLRVPPLRSGNEIGNDKDELDPRADIEHINDKTAIVKFTPNLERQKQLAHLLSTKDLKGFAGQFVVQYDVERDPKGEVLIQDGYFVHFFAPSELEPLPKHVVFVLDTSSSMDGQKIVQLREAMLNILDQLHSNDLFNLVEFSTNVKVRSLDNSESSFWYDDKFDDISFPNAYSANPDNIKKAKATVSNLTPYGETDIHTALRVGLHLVELAKKRKADNTTRQAMVIFLTDGVPTVGVTFGQDITNNISEFNTGSRKSPIFTLSFGRGADKKFLEKLALRNSGFNKHIYEAADASLQLQDFYRQISSPLLSDVTFKYEPSVTSLTETNFPIHFDDSELVVAGWCGTPDISPVVDGWGVEGRISLKPKVQHSVSNIERLWAYLTVKQLLEKNEVSDRNNDELKKKILDLALKYSFVTPVSSLVVVKPNDTNVANTEAAGGGPRYGNTRFGSVNYKHRPATLVPPRQYKVSPGSAIHAPIPHYGGSLRILPTTTTLAPTSSTDIANKVPDLLSALPWLKTILNENGTLGLPSGNFKLGLNETISDVVTCPKTPLNSSGHCTLLHSCPQVHSLLISSDVFVRHFCILRNEFAGICCPSSS